MIHAVDGSPDEDDPSIFPTDDILKMLKLFGPIINFSSYTSDKSRPYITYEDEGDAAEAIQIINSLVVGKLRSAWAYMADF